MWSIEWHHISVTVSEGHFCCLEPFYIGKYSGVTCDVYAWWGFSNVNDRQKIFAFIRRCLRTGFCSPDLADFSNLYSSSDDKLYKKILTRPDHILRTLLPPPTEQNYNLRNRPHNRQLPDRISRITDCNFIVRMLYSNMYLLLYRPTLPLVLLGRLKMREWKMRYGQNCKGGKCRSGNSRSRSHEWKMQEWKMQE